MAAIGLFITLLIYAWAGLNIGKFFFQNMEKKKQTVLSFLLFLAFMLPFENTLNLVLGYTLRPLTLFIPFLLFLFVLYRIFENKFKLNLLDILALLLMAIGFIYIFPALTTISLSEAMMGFFLQFQAFFVYFIVRYFTFEKEEILKLSKVAFICLFILLAYGVYEFIFARYELIDWIVANSHHPFAKSQANSTEGFYRQKFLGDFLYRSQSFLLEFVSFGYYGFLLSSICFAVYFLHKVKKKRFLLLALIISFLGLLSSVTLSSLTATLVTFAIVFGFSVYNDIRKLFNLIKVVFFSICVFFLFYAFNQETKEFIDNSLEAVSLIDRLQAHSNATKEDNSSFFLNNLFGHGTGVAVTNIEGLFIEQEYKGNFAEWGLLGYLLYIAFYLVLIYTITKLIKINPLHSLGYALSVGAFCLAIGFGLTGFVHNLWGSSTSLVIFFGLVGILLTNYKTLNQVEELKY